MTTTLPAKTKTEYTPDERRARAELVASLLGIDHHFDTITPLNHKRFRVVEYDGRQFDVLIEEKT